MGKYDRLITLSFRLSPDVRPGTLTQSFAAARVPPTWREWARTLNNMCRNGEGYKYPPVASLNKTLIASIRGITAIGPKAWEDDDLYWIYHPHGLDRQNSNIAKIAHRLWMFRSFSNAPEDILDTALQITAMTDLEWETIRYDPVQFGQYINGTANLGDQGFLLLPHYIAQWLTQPDMTFHFGGRELRFLRRPLGRQGVELIEWPPRTHGKAFYSYFVTLTAQTVPFRPYPVVHCYLGLRRWINKWAKIPFDKSTSVYLLDRTQLDAADAPCFQVASVSRKKVKGKWRWVWDDTFVELMGQIDPWRSYPYLNDFIYSPDTGYEKDLLAAIVYREGIEPKHKVGPGLGPRDRDNLIKQFLPVLEPEWELLEYPKVSNPQIAISSNPFFAKIDAEETPQEMAGAIYASRRQSVAKVVEDSFLIFEIRHQSEMVRHALAREIRSYFGLSPQEGDYCTWQTPELTLIIHAEDQGDIGTELYLDEGIKKPSERRARAVFHRADEIVNRTPPAQGTVITLVEIAGKEAFEKNRDRDPFAALRLGLGRTGRLVHFIVTGEDGLEQRAKSTILDSLRQLGVLVDTDILPTGSIPPDTNYAGLWLIKKYQVGGSALLPVCVRVQPTLGRITATALGLNGWRPYRELLLAIARGEAKGGKDQADVIGFIDQLLAGMKHQNTLVMCHAQNLRSVWPWLTNAEITIDTLAFGKRVVPIDRLPGIRLIRTRDSSSYETPQCYAAGDNVDYGFGEGVYAMDERVFASVSDKPRQMKDLSVELSKAERWQTRAGKYKDTIRDPEPGKYAWNPNLLELAVACLQRGDDPAAWAELAHRLRGAAIHYDEAVRFPIPEHLAMLAREYAFAPPDETDSPNSA